jgi:hypothetical protein
MNYPLNKLHGSAKKFYFTFGAAFVVLAAILFAPVVNAPAFVPTNWTAAATYPTTIARYGFAQVGQDLYVISGVSNGAIVNTVNRYNATTNVWSPLAPIPVGSEAPAAAYFNGKIYVADGLGGGNLIRIYNIATNTWSNGPPRPGVTSSFGAGAGAFNGNVYVIGGGSGPSTTLSIYNIAGNSWSAGPAAPSAYRLGGYTQVGRFLYLVGSFPASGTTNSNVSMRLDMATNSWSIGPVFAARRADFGLAAAGSSLFAIGGDSNTGGFFDPSVRVDELLDTTTWPVGSWTALLSDDQLPSPRQANQAGFLSSGRASGEIWSTGGIGAGNVYLNQHLYLRLGCLNYAFKSGIGQIVPGATDTGNHCDDCTTPITLPFPATFHGTTFTTANVSSNGNIEFVSNAASQSNSMLPNSSFNWAIFPFWDDLLTNVAGKGIFTSVQGFAPRRVFNIEWRTAQFNGPGTTNFELRLFENSPNLEVIYGATTGTFTGTIGLQRDTGSLFTQVRNNTNVLPSGTRTTFAPGCCPPITFNGTLGSNSITYPGSSGVQTDRVLRLGEISVCGSMKNFPGTAPGSYTYDQYSFTNDGPATCMTFSVTRQCAGSSQFIFPVAYLGSFDPANISTNYLGDPGVRPDPYAAFSVDVPENSTVVLVVSEIDPGVGCDSYIVTVTGLTCPFELVAAASRKMQGAMSFDINLPLTGSPGVECRSGAAGHTLVFTFTNSVVSGSASVTGGVGTAGAASFSGNTMTVPLSGVMDQQKITVTLNGVTDVFTQVLPATSVSMNVLLGDTTANKTVNASDISQVKAQSGAVANAANFRTDTNVSGTINASDVSQVKANSGHGVP